jgi:hypothetical protein
MLSQIVFDVLKLPLVQSFIATCEVRGVVVIKKLGGFNYRGWRFWLIMTISVCFLCNCSPYLFMYYTVHDFVLTTAPQLFTSPLEPPVVSDICRILDLDEKDPRCQAKATYTYEFFPDFHKRYQVGTSQQQIDQDIGNYLIGCTEWTTAKFDGETDQFCFYDFRGDGMFTLYFHMFKQSCDDPNSSIKNMCSYRIGSLPFNSFQCSNSSTNWPVIRKLEDYSFDSHFRRRCEGMQLVLIL